MSWKQSVGNLSGLNYYAIKKKRCFSMNLLLIVKILNAKGEFPVQTLASTHFQLLMAHHLAQYICELTTKSLVKVSCSDHADLAIDF